ncbi:hypothetical protein J7376_18405 [Paracoccus sp. R12_1]|uniref:hypothetical protein n=1 Tax=unclassified Paracoccus (in: a-proteobacteria) TaxID=2688777 RepID=UPI001ADAC2D5|nr:MULTISPECIES: hypothetical protein [unclassified Paracoccus (in: a-proteobacteria)]MBO9457210.1 hypothetical protein [Paracoccus sp. R12_2]MBO9488491.1 hypothetical protein [Paracoccus sp. R12_1]
MIRERIEELLNQAAEAWADLQESEAQIRELEVAADEAAHVATQAETEVMYLRLLLSHGECGPRASV